MVVVQCPHCNEDIELGDDNSGLFDCPHCDKEFEYESSSDNGNSNLTPKMVLVLSSISIMIISSGFFLINESLTKDEYIGPTTECEFEREGLWFIPSDCEQVYPEDYQEYDSKSDEFCGGIIFLLIGFGIGITTFVARFRGRVRFEGNDYSSKEK